MPRLRRSRAEARLTRLNRAAAPRGQGMLQQSLVNDQTVQTGTHGCGQGFVVWCQAQPTSANANRVAMRRWSGMRAIACARAVAA